MGHETSIRQGDDWTRQVKGNEICREWIAPWRVVFELKVFGFSGFRVQFSNVFGFVGFHCMRKPHLVDRAIRQGKEIICRIAIGSEIAIMKVKAVFV